MRFGPRYYFNPTPKQIRKLADSLLAATSVLSSSALMQNYNAIALISLSIGVVCKFISNFFSENDGP